MLSEIYLVCKSIERNKRSESGVNEMENKPKLRAARRAAAVIIDTSSDSEYDGKVTIKKRKKSLSEDDWNPDEVISSDVKERPGKRSAQTSQRKEPANKKRKAAEHQKVQKRKIENASELTSSQSTDVTGKPLLQLKSIEDLKRSISKALSLGVEGKSSSSITQIDHSTKPTCCDKGENEVKTKDTSQMEMGWKEAELLAANEGLDLWVANNLSKLFEEDNTVPFIARYRKELTRNMAPEQLRHAKETYEEVKLLKQKAMTTLKSIEKMGKATPEIRQSILVARSFSELDHISAPLKSAGKKTLAGRARELGLEPYAMKILEGVDAVNLNTLINPEKEGLHSEEEIKLGIQHIIADVISKNSDVHDHIQALRKQAHIRLGCSQAKVNKTNQAKSKSLNPDKPKSSKMTAAEKLEVQTKLGETSKFKTYFKFNMHTKLMKPHQVLAINRGESLKELSVHVEIPECVLPQITSFCERYWLSKGWRYPLRSLLIDNSIKDAYKRLIEPLLIRQVRAELNQSAERASIEVFAMNLKSLLLMPPFRGHTVLGIDPGFHHGCKIAVVAESGKVLQTKVLYLHGKRKPNNLHGDEDASWLRSIMIKYGCAIIALGNGKACRETEEYLSKLIQAGLFKPQLDVSYTIVNEQGASIYSCSEEARKEFPDLDPNLIGAVSLARRLQDPLAELVKIDPKHQGVGMYQHDVPEKKLSATLDEVVSECVSFVGVDLNTASHCLLRRIAGLNASRAEKIIEYRKNNGAFTNRDILKKVKGIGSKTFEQCAGFVRILPETVGSWDTGSKCNPLDRTWIHPESYNFTIRLLNHCEAELRDFGSHEFNEKINQAVSSAGGIACLAQQLNEAESLVKLVVDGLQLPPNFDLRSEFDKPLFRKGMTSMDDLHSSDIVTGKVTNITHFGAFVDIGVGHNGLIHNSSMGNKVLKLGDKVQVKIINLELVRKRIGLQLLHIL